MSSDQQTDVAPQVDEQPAEQRDVEEQARSRTEIPRTEAFTRYIASGWAERTVHLPSVAPMAQAAPGYPGPGRQ